MEPRLHNLPAPTNSFIGRDKELSALASLLSRARLITLVGMSGIGKTRLALELARQLVNASKRRHPFPDGVWFVSLESLSDASQIIAAIGEVLCVQWQEGVVPLKTLTSFCASRRLLLLLDTAEHLVHRGLGDVLRQLLSAAPHLFVLVTSQVELHLQGEHVFPVEPLMDAVQLFAARARQRVPNWRLTEENAPLVAEICRHVDNVPLSVELAAGQLRPLTERQILDGITRSLGVLDDSDGDRPSRHRGLKAALAWSWQSLTEEERHALECLSVLDSGTFFADAVTPVTELSNGESVALSLCRKGLLQVEDPRSLGVGEALGQARYRTLESVRRFVQEDTRRNTQHAPRERAAMHYLSRMVEESRRRHDNEAAAAAWFRVEWVNLRQVYHWTLTAQRWEWAASFLGMAKSHLEADGLWRELEEMTFALYERVRRGDVPLASLGVNAQARHSPYVVEVGITDLSLCLGWLGLRREARDLLRQFLNDRRDSLDGAAAARVWQWLGGLENELGNSEEAERCLKKQLEIARRSGDAKTLVFALMESGRIACLQKRLDEARAYTEEGLTLASQHGLNDARASLLANLFTIAEEGGRLEEACRLGAEHLAHLRRNGNPHPLCGALQQQAWRHLLIGELDLTEALLRESVDLGRRVGPPKKLAWACLNLCQYVLVPRGAYEEALPLQREALAAARRVNDDHVAAAALNEMAILHLAQGDLAAARRAITDAHLLAQTPKGLPTLPDVLTTRGRIRPYRE